MRVRENLYSGLHSIILFYLLFHWVFFNKNWQLIWQQSKVGDHVFFSVPTLLAHKHSDIYVQSWNWDYWFVLIRNDIDQPLVIRSAFDSMITVTSQRQAVHSNSHRLSTKSCKQTEWANSPKAKFSCPSAFLCRHFIFSFCWNSAPKKRS